MKIWDGTSTTRSDILVRKAPDGEDWRTITKELRATQKFIANLAVNADEMPDLIEGIKVQQKQLKLLQISIAKLTLPEDVEAHVDQLEAEMEKLHNIYQHAAEVLQTVNFLQRQLLNLGERIDDHIKETNIRERAFENRVANWQRVNEERWNNRLKKAEEQLGAISLALGLKAFGES